MAKRKLKKVPKTRKRPGGADLLRSALAKRTKAELVDALMELASDDRRIDRQLQLRFDVQAAPDDLVAATRRAIADAADFDERGINYNFDYDYAAYEAVERNLRRLIQLGHLDVAMELSLELMSKGSRQVEMSDEGLMTDDIEQCLEVVIKALKKGDLPAGDVSAWCAAMLKKDRVGFICDEALRGLQERCEATSSG